MRVLPPEEEAAITTFRSHRDDFVEVANDDKGTGALARQAYAALLPRLTLSRCPFTGAPIKVTFDPIDFDGPYWDALAPARGDRHALPRTVFSLSGAAQLRPPVPVAPFLAVPGPEVPFVVPELLNVEGVVAVISSVAVGRHIGFPIAYFAQAGPPPRLRLNCWGARSFHYVYDGGRVISGESELYDVDYVYDLEPWLEKGKLRWIHPDDDELTVLKGVENCPYLGLSGRRQVMRIANGEVFWPI